MPRRGPVILAPNHTSFCDSFFLPLVIAPQGDLRRQGRVLRLVEDSLVLPGRRARSPCDARAARHRSGRSQLPGTSSKAAGCSASTRKGRARLTDVSTAGTRESRGSLSQCGVPVIPVGITGTTDVQPVGSNMMRPFKKSASSSVHPSI